MIGSLLFISWRIFELVTLIPAMGMLAYFVAGYNQQNQLTPAYILVLFIVTVLAVAYCFFTLFKVPSVRRNGFFVAFLDLCFMGALIAGVYELRGITNMNCLVSTGGFSSSSSDNSITISWTDLSLSADKACSMLKASFAFGIINCIVFPITALIAISMHRTADVEVKEVYRSRSHGSRRGHSRRRSSSHSRRQYYV